MKAIIKTEWEKVYKSTPNFLGQYLDVDYFLGTILTELYAFTADNKDYTESGRKILLEMAMRESRITSTPAIGDPYASFGAYQMTLDSYNGLQDFGSNVKNQVSAIKPGPFEKCLSFRDQTKMIAWLTMDKIKKLENLFKETGSESKLKTMFQNNPHGAKKFTYKCLRLLHVGLLRWGRGNLKSLLKKTPNSFTEFEQKFWIAANMELKRKSDKDNQRKNIDRIQTTAKYYD